MCDQAADALAPAFRLAVAVGLRRGELVGLPWADVDLDEGTVRITETIVTVGRKATASTPKTRRSARVVALDADTCAALRAWRRVQAAQRLAFGAGWADTGLVFTRPDGAAWHPDTVSSRFRTLARRAGLPAIPLKNLRHSSATLGLESGETLKEVSERLGHSTVTITADVYSAVTLATARGSAERRAAALRRTGCDPNGDPRGPEATLTGTRDGRSRRSVIMPACAGTLS